MRSHCIPLNQLHSFYAWMMSHMKPMQILHWITLESQCCMEAAKIDGSIKVSWFVLEQMAESGS